MPVSHENVWKGMVTDLKVKEKENRFSDETVAAAWRRSDGRCECHELDHLHEYLRCHRRLVWEYRGTRESTGGWEAVPLIDNPACRDFSVGNCRVICRECAVRHASALVVGSEWGSDDG
jgi:hypothetical protein